MAARRGPSAASPLVAAVAGLGLALALISLAGLSIVAFGREHARQRLSPSVMPLSDSHRAKAAKAAGSHAPTAGPEPTAVAHVLRYTRVITAGGGHRGLIALTFDDGPSPYTAQIVEELVRLHAPATFFVVGQQVRYFPAGLRDELGHGFEVGDHTQNHTWLIRLAAQGQYRQIYDDLAAVEDVGDRRPLLFRPPYGAFNDQTLAVLRRLGMLTVLWSIDPRDWLRPGAAAIVQAVLSAARPGGIVLLHDGGGNRLQTVSALPAIIGGLQARHYRLVTIAQLLAQDPPPSTNGGVSSNAHVQADNRRG